METLILSPDSGSGTGKAAIDGQVFYQTAGVSTGVSWSTIHGASSGTGNNDNSSYRDVTMITSSQSSDTWYSLMRTVLMFNTAQLPPGAIINSATLSLYGLEKYNTNTAYTNPAINICSVTTAANNTLSNSDFGGFGNTKLSSDLTYTNFSTSGYNNFALNADGLAAINKTGITKLGVKFVPDFTTSSPGWGEGSQRTTMSVYLADDGSSTIPKLTINYSVPAAFFMFM